MEEIIDRFNRGAIRYLLIGGQAIRLHGLPRFSLDWDLFIPNRDTDNIGRINEILSNQIDLPLVPLGSKGEYFIQTYQLTSGVLQFHLVLPGVSSFDEAYRRRVNLQTETGLVVASLCSEDLLASKKAANRPADQLDIEFLEKKREQENL